MRIRLVFFGSALHSGAPSFRSRFTTRAKTKRQRFGYKTRKRKARFKSQAHSGYWDVPQAELKNHSGGLWRVGKSLEAFALKVASRWQTAFSGVSAKIPYNQWRAWRDVDHLRCRFGRFKLGAHFLKAGSELFNLFFQSLHPPSTSALIGAWSGKIIQTRKG